MKIIGHNGNIAFLPELMFMVNRFKSPFQHFVHKRMGALILRNF